MNSCIILGRLTKDPELRTAKSGKNVCSFTVAVDRRFTNAQGNRETDFLFCVAFDRTADFVNKFFCKGRKICVRGSVQTRDYDAQDGSKRHVTEIVAEEVDFADSKEQSTAPVTNDTNAPIPCEDPDDLPFD